MPEWSNGAVSKTVVRLCGPGVRIPLSPQSQQTRKPRCAEGTTGLFLLNPLKIHFQTGSAEKDHSDHRERRAAGFVGIADHSPTGSRQ